MVKDITLNDEIKDLERELGLQKRLYPGWTKGPNPKVKPADAEHQLACIEATISRLKKIRDEAEKAKGIQTKLF